MFFFLDRCVVNARTHICINIIGMHEDRKQFISIVNSVYCILHMSYKLGKTLHIHIQIVPITLKPGYNEP